MKRKTEYFVLPGSSAENSLFLLKFDGRYSYWGNRSKKWICDPTLLKQHWIDDYFQHITKREAKKIILEEEISG